MYTLGDINVLRQQVEWLTFELIKKTNESESRQAKIDSLMLEFCPDEMTEEQIETWGLHQRRADKTPLDISETNPSSFVERVSIAPTYGNGMLIRPEGDKFVSLMNEWQHGNVGDESRANFDNVVEFVDNFTYLRFHAGQKSMEVK